MRRLLVLLVVVLLAAGGGLTAWALTQSGDDTDSSDSKPTPTASSSETDEPSSSQEAPDPTLQKFYDQKVAWSKCDENKCARIEVPLDYAKPNGPTIELALLDNVADEPSQRVGYLVVNPGGPGAPGTSYAERADLAFGQPLRDRFDIVGFDPRGTGTSSPVDCLSDKELDDYIASDPDPDNPAELGEFRDWTNRIGSGCATKSGRLAAHVSTVEAARDLDVVRAVLGEDKLTYFGASYGTKLGATYADLFPDRTGRLVLDGAVDVSLSNLQLGLQQAAGFQLALTAYIDDCIDGGECYLGGTRAAALATIKNFLNSVDQQPLKVGKRELAVGNAFYGIVVTLYNKDYWEYLTGALSAALDGRGAGLLELSDIYVSRDKDGTYSDNSAEAIYAINCLDDPEGLSLDKVPDYFARFEKASPTFGRVFAYSLSGCDGMQVPRQPERPPLTATGAAPLLVIGTTRDPATPFHWAVKLAAQLESAILVKRDGDGHTGYNMGNDCVDNTVEDYLIDGKVPSDDVDCPA